MIRAPSGISLAGELRGIPRPVQPLVVVGDDPRQLVVPDPADHFRPHGGVALDHLELLLRQLAGLVEDVERDHELADVVNGGREADPGHLGRRDAELLGDHGRVPGHSTGVPVRVRISRLQRGGEPLQGLEPRLGVQLVASLADALGVDVQQGNGVAQTSLQAPAPQPPPEHEVGEEKVPGSWAHLPEDAAAVGDQQRGDEPDGEQRHEVRDHAGERDAPDHRRRCERHRRGRREGVRQVPHRSVSCVIHHSHVSAAQPRWPAVQEPAQAAAWTHV